MHTVGYASALRKEALTPAIPWRGLEDTVLSEISQTQKDVYRDSACKRSLEESES